GALHAAVEEMARAESFHGYGPEQGYEFLAEQIAAHDYAPRGVTLGTDEIFISDGAKSDTANIQEIFAPESVVALTDPVYPVYVDSNVMAGRSGEPTESGYTKFVYLPCTAENSFQPELPERAVDLIYLCYPNNPTGATMTRAALTRWVKFARERKAVILYDAAYEAYI
ncbi:MAG: LL-diaminopimelate aminotransferase, partial [Chloroflexota bacterium]